MRVLCSIAAVVLLAALVAGVSFDKKADEIPKELGAEDASYVPSPKNPREKTEMICSACLTASLEVLAALRKLRKEFLREPDKLKEYHFLSAVGDICTEKSLHMGLLRDGPSKKVTTIYANDADPKLRGKYAIVKGAWVTHLWQQECFVTIDRLEDDLRVIYDDDGKTFHFCPMCASAGQKGRLHEATLTDEQKSDL
jgi:hypothetical protein